MACIVSTDVVLDVADVVVLVLLDDAVRSVVLLVVEGHEPLAARFAARLLHRVNGLVGKVRVRPVVADFVVGVTRRLLILQKYEGLMLPFPCLGCFRNYCK